MKVDVEYEGGLGTDYVLLSSNTSVWSLEVVASYPKRLYAMLSSN